MPPKYQYSVENLRAHLKRYAAADALAFINRWSRSLLRRGHPDSLPGALVTEGLTVTQWDVAFLAKQIILCSNDHRSRLLSKDFDGFRNALFMTDNIHHPFVLLDSPTIDDFGRFLISTAYQQFRHQGWGEASLFRTYALFEHSWRGLPPEFDIEMASRSVYGMSLRVFLILGLCVLSLAASADFSTFSQNALSNVTDERLSSIRPHLTERNIANFWRHTLADYSAFRGLCKDFATAPSFARYAFNPLESRPIILTQAPKKICVVPSISSLILRLSDGIYHDLFNHYNSQGNHHPFTNFFGKMFESYVGMQLRHHFGEDKVIGERKYTVGKREWLGPDWIAIDGDAAIVVECSTARLVVDGKVQAESERLRTEARKKLADMVRLFPAKIAHLKDMPSVWPELSVVKRFYAVIVTVDPWWPPATFQQILEAQLKDEGVTVMPYHLVSIDELERLMPLAVSGIPISTVLQERLDQGRQGDFLGEDIRRKLQEYGVEGDNLLLERARDELFESVVPEPNDSRD